MPGILAYGSYVPASVVDRTELANVLGEPPGKGVRSTSAGDEDTTTMAVEAARRIPDLPDVRGPLWFATSRPAYLDKTNATAIHAAAGLAPTVPAIDLGSAVRSGIAALRAAADGGGLAVLADVWTGLAGSDDERDGGDGAAAFLFGDGTDVVAEVLAGATRTIELLDRWRLPDDDHARTWDAKFGAQVLGPAAGEALADAMSTAGLERVDRAVVSGPNRRAVKAALRGMPAEGLAGVLDEVIGYVGAADVGLGLASALDEAEPGQTIAVVSLADGVDVMVLRATERLAEGRAEPSLSAQLAGRRTIPYATFLTWRGQLRRQPPRRPEPQGPAAPPSSRNAAWKFALVASRCTACATVCAPPIRVCRECGAVDQMTAHPLADRRARVVDVTVDRLAYSLDPPVTVAVLDFEGGGRFACEITDATPGDVRIGDQVQMTFRRLFTAEGVHDYFWKARPLREAAIGDEEVQ